MASFKIGREFFAKAKADYADWRWSWVREISQNSMDCGSSQIDVTLERDGANTQIAVSNDGQPMSEDILIDKFLTLGGSAKDDGVGGFGKAKELLVCCHLHWSIRTGSLLAEGEGGEYELTSGLTPLHGTTTTVLMEGDEVGRLVGMFQRFAALTQWKGTLTVNGQVLATDLRKGSPRREYEWGKVYTNQQYSNLLVVRIGGQPMFTRNIKFKGCVLVELGVCCTLHQLRHTHATELINGGVSLATIRKRLGHKNLQTTLRYAEQSDATADAEVRAWWRKQDRSR